MKKRKAAPAKTPTTRVRFLTRDGSVIMDRESEIINDHAEVRDYILKCNANDKGVRILKTDLGENVITCTVEWLRAK